MPGTVETVALLLAGGADVNAQDGDGQTPLHWAASNALNDVVNLLLERGADINARDKYGNTPLQEAKAYWSGHDSTEIQELLRQRGGEL